MGAGTSRRLGTVRARLTLLASGVVLLVLVAVAVLLVVTQRDALVGQLDDRLELDAERIATAVAADGEVPTTDDDDVLVVVLVDGAVREANVDGDLTAAMVAADDGTVELDGERHRLARADDDDAVDGDVEVVVATSLDDVDETVAALVRTLAVVVPGATLLLAVVVWVLVGRTLRPVERIRAEVSSIGLDELGRRVPVPAGDDEIARLATTMNEMLERLDGAHRRQQRFVADASHELRTPLTRMRTELEVPGGDPDALRRSVLDDVVTLQRLIDDLLVLARRDAGATTATRLVDLDEIVLEEARVAGGVDVSAVSAAQVRGDPAALRRVVRNLLDNARRHATARVAVAVREDGDVAVVTVDDDGPGIPPDRRAEVFRRFTRLDDARTSAGRSGLGLAIVDAVVTEHGGAVAIDDSPLGGARVEVRLPRLA